MARRYRRETALGIKDVLASFDGRPVPAVLFDPKKFSGEYKGKDRSEIGHALNAETENIELPNIVFSASIESIYPQIAAQLDQERGAFAVGFPKHRFGSEDRVFWLAAEIDSKLPATAELTEFWCDRLEAAAISAGLENSKLWLITPDGFEDDACDILTGRGSVGSSRMQAEFISQILKNETPAAAGTGEEEMAEYEIVIPMSSESELIAAHTLEEIAKRHGFKVHDINQIKTALVEACINAVEHSHSPDRRIRQKFTVGHDKITIDVTNRGLRLADAPRPDADSARRGWGLKLMEKLMDEVTINDTDDGTSITMVKQFKAA
jgi:serine/threonine-protein kinase RsbW